MISKLLLSLILTVSLQVYGSNENNNSLLVKRSHVTDSPEILNNIERKKQKKFFGNYQFKKDTRPASKQVLEHYPLVHEIFSYLDLENDMYQALGGDSLGIEIYNYKKFKNIIAKTILCQNLLRQIKPDYTLQRTDIPGLENYRLPYVHPKKSDISITSLSRVHSEHFIWFDPIFEHNDIKTAKIMLRYGANVNAINWNGDSILYRACNEGNEAMAKLAIDYGADVNQRTHYIFFSTDQDNLEITPLHAAIILAKSLPIARMLLEKGADINSRNYFDQTPLMAALDTDILQKDLVTLLLQYNPDFTRKDYDGKTCLHTASYHSLDHVKILLENGAQSVINVQDNRGQTPLHIAVKYGITDNVKLLLQHGADTTIQDNNGKTPLNIIDSISNNCSIS